MKAGADPGDNHLCGMWGDNLMAECKQVSGEETDMGWGWEFGI